MSLKAFHVFFIGVSILLAFGVGVWGIYVHVQETDVSLLLFGIGSLLVGGVLVLYGVKVLRRLRRL